MPNVQVSIQRCSSYDPKEVYDSLKEALALLGGVENFIKKGENVLIKPNLLSARLPEEGVTTHPEVVRAVIRSVSTQTSDICIGDSPGGIGKNIEEIWERSGIGKVAKEEGVSLVKFDKSRMVKGVPVAQHVLDCQRLISVPKFKTHNVTILTAGIKNLFGIVPGLYKANAHAANPKHEEFSGTIADIFSIRPPDLTIIDAIVAMEGNGPAAGSLRNMNILAAASDAVALDAVLSKIIGIEPLSVAVTSEACKRGLGTAELSKIDILGCGVEDVKQHGFKMPNMYIFTKVPAILVNLFAKLIRFSVVIDKNSCRDCRLCQEACPVGAIDMAGKKIDRSKCILCLCCQEICPYKAIDIQKSLPARIIWG